MEFAEYQYGSVYVFPDPAYNVHRGEVIFMGKGPRDKKKGSLSNAQKSGKQYQNGAGRSSLKDANRVFSWFAGIALALAPPLACWGAAALQKSNEEMAENFHRFPEEFVSSGSFLWLAITVLVMSLTDLLLYGFRDGIGERLKYKFLVFVSVVFCVLGILIYFMNIGSPVDDFLLLMVSLVAFILFAIASGILSFKISKGG